ncbi:hypothetical protein EAH87_14835 [Sphingomonas koreensis]|nr:hypothetical protein EAH87_14835 [Sphingomonas koreensis]
MREMLVSNWSQQGRRAATAFLLALSCALLIGHCMRLDADTPRSAQAWDEGRWADEGYKTLAPRNLVMMGHTQWNAQDRYRGWFHGSPITQSLFYLSFKAFGQGFVQARIVPLLFFFIAFFAIIFAYRAEGSAVALAFAAFVLSSNYLLFEFSRIAIFETFLIAAVVLALVAVRRFAPAPNLKAILIMAAVSLLAMRGIKASAALYLGPAIVGIAAAWLAARRWRMTPAFGAALAVLVLGVLATAYASRGIWLTRLGDQPWQVVDRVLNGPLTRDGAMVLPGGMLAAAWILSRRIDLVLNSSYRAALLGVVVLTPLAVAQFRYDPLRYWVPMLPAFLLLALDCAFAFSSRSAPPANDTALPRWMSPVLPVCGVAALCLASYWFFNELLNGWVLGLAPDVFGHSKIAALAAAVTAAVVWKRRALTDDRVATALVAVLMIEGTAGTIRICDQLRVAPTDRAAVQARFAAVLPPGATLAGNYAPALALGTPYRALYLGGSGNDPRFVTALRPDYFVDLATDADKATLMSLDSNPAVRLGPPLIFGSYARRQVILHHLFYVDHAQRR